MGCFKKDPYLPYGGNICHPRRGEEKCLKMAKGKGRHVKLNLSKGLHVVKSYCSWIYGEIYKAS